MLPYSTRPTAEAILSDVPALAPYARPAVLLHPTPGSPGPHDSSVAGPLLWPADEPWPVCSVPDALSTDGQPASAMIPVIQVFRRDAPGDWWPEDADVFQVLWCPNEHGDPPAPQADANPVVEVRWRRTADLPATPHAPPRPTRQADPDDGFSPAPCLLTSVPLTDFPYPECLPDDIERDVARLVEATRHDDHGDLITRVAGCKFGGWPSWHLTGPGQVDCPACGIPMDLLFTIASDDTTNICVGRWGDLRIFVCPADAEHGHVFDVH
ncbi:hypothetical protein [Streptomyces sp. enrichment culture]|uniref:hypothetical protein n=1 Tax=Streptomyces sp. enrichment culture TaxID=1795815 RepID=UPI003F57C22C